MHWFETVGFRDTPPLNEKFLSNSQTTAPLILSQQQNKRFFSTSLRARSSPNTPLFCVKLVA